MESSFSQQNSVAQDEDAMCIDIDKGHVDQVSRTSSALVGNQPISDDENGEAFEEYTKSLAVDLEPDVDFSQTDPTQFDFGISIPEYRLHTARTSTEGTRLCVKAIVTENFKSFHGKKVLGPFDKRFTAIVGPNGCGKSNTIDSLLFVFGFRSSKLRTQKLQELIHSSAEHPDCAQAKVTVYFAVVPTAKEGVEIKDEFNISRSVSKKSESLYFINGSKSTQHEVAAKLREYGVDLDHNRFLILQGEVEQIALMKPTSHSEHEEGMLEYLEDIIGSNRYKKPIQEFEEVLANLSLEIDGYDTIHDGLKNNLVTMMRQKLNAENFLECQGEVFRLQHRLVQIRLLKLRRLLADNTLALKESQAALAVQEEALEELLKRKAEFACGQNMTQSSVKNLQKTYDSAVAEHRKLDEEKADADQELKNRKAEKKRLKSEIKKLDEDMSALKEKIQASKDRKSELEDDLKKISSDIFDEENLFATAQEQVSSSTKELKKSKTKLEESRRTVTAEKQKSNLAVDEKKAELNSMRRSVDLAGNRLNELRNKLKSVREASDAMEIKQAADSLKEQQLTAEYEQCLQRKNQLDEEKSKLESDIKRNRESLLPLKSNLQSDSSTHSRHAAINELMDCKRRKSIPGIVGRLGDLGAIDKQYEVAICATAGGFLDFVVVESVECSRLCVEHLRRTNKGRASILVLDQISRSQCVKNMNVSKSFPEKCSRLFDLVRIEDINNQRLRSAFYYALRDTLVAKDLQQADRVANYGHERHRVVTYDGKIIEVSGAMTGGGSSSDIEIRIGQQIVARSQISDTTIRNQVSELEKREALLLETLQPITAELISISSNLPILKRNLEEIKFYITHSRKDLDINKRLQESFPQQIRDAEANLARQQTNAAEETRINDEISALVGVAAEIDSRLTDLNTKIDTIDRKIWDIRGEKVRGSEKTLQKLKNDLKLRKTEMDTLSTEIKASTRALSTKTNQHENKSSLLEENGQRITEIEEILQTLPEKVRISKENVAKFAVELNDAKRSFEHFSEKLQKLEDDIESQETARGSAKKQVQQMEKILGETKARIEEVTPSLEKIKSEADARPHAKPVDLKILEDEELQKLERDSMKARVEELETKLDKMTVNLTVIEMFAEEKKKFDEHLRNFRGIKEKHAVAKIFHGQLNENRTREFKESFAMIQSSLKKTYYLLTSGGDADLLPVSTLNVFGEGIEFTVRPPNKSWKVIHNLSGGEKTLSSLSLIFALHSYKPTPFYIMDEIDAALDYHNVSVVGEYIRTRAVEAQFIVVSLRPNMYQLASRHIGIFKVNNSTEISLLASCAPNVVQIGAHNKKDGNVGKELDKHRLLKEAQKAFTEKLLSRTTGCRPVPSVDSRKRSAADADLI